MYALSASARVYPAQFTISSPRATDREHILDDMESYKRWVEIPARLLRYVGLVTKVMLCLYELLCVGMLLNGAFGG